MTELAGFLSLVVKVLEGPVIKGTQYLLRPAAKSLLLDRTPTRRLSQRLFLLGKQNPYLMP